MKEMEVKETELAMQVSLKELETGPAPRPSDSGSSRPVGLDISKHVHFVPLSKNGKSTNISYTLKK